MNDLRADAWAHYWSHPDRGGCLPAGGEAMTQALRQVWRGVAQTCPRGAKVLDIATGDGAVLRHLQASRADLKLFGIDAAPTLPAMPKGAKVRAGCAMERLPFQDGAFTLVTSQFGFEYGRTEQAAGEIGRVLAAGGSAALLVHRGDGPILARNLARGEAIRWVLAQGVLEPFVQPGQGPGATMLRTMRLQVVAQHAVQRVGVSSPALEILEAARLIIGRPSPPDEVTAALRALQARAEDELQRIEALREAAARADARSILHRHLERAGLTLLSTSPVRVGTDRPFGDLLQLRKD